MLVGQGTMLALALEWSRGRPKVDEQLRTSAGGLWAAVDGVDERDAVPAVADGHEAPASINDYLSIREQAA